MNMVTINTTSFNCMFTLHNIFQNVKEIKQTFTRVKEKILMRIKT